MTVQMKLQPSMTVIALVFVAAASAFAGAFVSDLVSRPAEAQQVHQFGYVQAEGFTLARGGLVRAQLTVDQSDNTILTLHDPTTQRGIILRVSQSGDASITDFQGQPLTAPRHSLPPLQLARPPGGGSAKGDDASQSDVSTVRDELSAIWMNLRTLQERVNEISR